MSEEIKVYVNGEEWKGAWEFESVYHVDGPSEIRVSLVGAPQHICIGPSCLEVVSTPEAIATWIHVARGQEYSWYFHSLRCMAEWLADELAKEEDHG